ncbi:hypothetical protein OH76DRAFT_99253 [Lentinus brumalis]|uniref:Uncharacterized protein n=1 Tax=Lentinus brumalis TaxID=2498619 RepID=A0A371CQF0_9APHY|nr:hypothetical protein OH76DRAFT_99253 [Polyporus brumalis]
MGRSRRVRTARSAATRARTSSSPSVAGPARPPGARAARVGADARQAQERVVVAEQKRGARQQRGAQKIRPRARVLQKRAPRARFPAVSRRLAHSSPGQCPPTPGSPTVRRRPHRHTPQAQQPSTPRVPVRVASPRASTRPPRPPPPCPSPRRAHTPTARPSTTTSSRSSTASRSRASLRIVRRSGGWTALEMDPWDDADRRFPSLRSLDQPKTRSFPMPFAVTA